MHEGPVLDPVACIREAKKGNLKTLDPVLGSMYGRLGMVLHHQVPDRFRNKLLECDLLQDALLVALQQFDNFHGDTEKSLFSWIAAIIRNTSWNAIHYLLAAKRDCTLEKSLEQWMAAPNLLDLRNFGPEEEAIQNEDLIFLDKAISGLSQEQEELIRCWIDGEVFTVLADKLGISRCAIYKRFERALDLLRKNYSSNLARDVGVLPPRMGRRDNRNVQKDNKL